MNIHDQISNTMDDVIARMFHMDKAYVHQHHELRFKEDLNANSKHYFPILSALADQFDLDIDYHAFQFHAITIEDAVDYAVQQYSEQNGAAS